MEIQRNNLMKNRVLSVKEKLSYGMGDAASHIVLDNIMMFMLFFYTDIFGIPAAFVGTMFLVARALDAVADPCMGLIADRTRSRWGKFRPWILFGALPFAIFCSVTYFTPELSLTGKMIYAAVTYTLLTLMYTVVNIPYCALGGVITSDPQQRVSLQSWRFVLSTAGGMLSTVLMMPLVNLIGGDDKAAGFHGAVSVLAAVAFLMLLFCAWGTREHVVAPESRSSAREDIRDVLLNDQWRVVALLTIINILSIAVRSGAMIYYVTWIMGNPAIFSWFLGAYCIGNMLGSSIAKPVTDKVCKVRVYFWCNIALFIVSVAMFFLPMNLPAVMFGFIFIIGFLYQLALPVQWVMMCDTVDYGEWQNGRRLTGISFAGTLFVLKMGLAVGGAIIGWLLAAGHYHPGAQTQTGSTVTIINVMFTLIPGACYLIAAFIVRRYYTLTTPFLTRILRELDPKAGSRTADNTGGKMNDGRRITESAPGTS
jgi:GPH family glycoside/pentoside/hexuronide:cation symporter